MTDADPTRAYRAAGLDEEEITAVTEVAAAVESADPLAPAVAVPAAAGRTVLAVLDRLAGDAVVQALDRGELPPAAIRISRARFAGMFAAAHIEGGVDVHYHGTPGLAGYAIDLREVIATARRTGLVVVPGRDGELRAFVLAPTPAVREWVEAGFAAESPPWRDGTPSGPVEPSAAPSEDAP